MRNFNILGFHWKIQLLGGFTKKQYRGGDCLKRGAWTVCQYIRGGLGKKEGGGVFEGWLIPPMRTMRVGQNLKKNLFFVSKITRIWWILIWALKSLKKLHFDWSLLCKVYNIWPKKVQWSIFHHTEESRKIWRKTDSWFGKWHEEFSKFSSEHLKMSKLVFSWDPFVQSRKCMSYKLHELQRSYK